VGAGAVMEPKDGILCELAGSLTAPKARIALQLALNAANKGLDKSKSLTWQDFFARIAVLPEYR
jgi:L-asparaginase